LKRFILLLLISLLILSGCSAQAETPKNEQILENFHTEFQTEGYFKNVTVTDKEIILVNHEDIEKIIDVKDVWIENKDFCIKYQNKLEENTIGSLTIELYYLDKDNKRIGRAAVFVKDNIKPNEIVVSKEPFYSADVEPEYIEEEWSGNLEHEFLDVFILPKE